MSGVFRVRHQILDSCWTVNAHRFAGWLAGKRQSLCFAVRDWLHLHRQVLVSSRMEFDRQRRGTFTIQLNGNCGDKHMKSKTEIPVLFAEDNSGVGDVQS